VESKNAATFIDDFKRLGKGFPDAVAKVRELSGAAEADFVVIANRIQILPGDFARIEALKGHSKGLRKESERRGFERARLQSCRKNPS
jgi:hypothetical protein